MYAKEILSELDFLRQVVAQAPGFVTVFLGREYRYAFMNRGMEVMLRGRNVIGQTVFEALPADLCHEITNRLDRVWKTGKPFMAKALAYRTYDKNKNDIIVRYGDFLHQPIKNHDGKMVGIYVQGIDVTDRKIAQENLAFLKHQSLSLMRDIIIMIENSVDHALETAGDLDSAYNDVQSRFDLLAELQASFLSNTNGNRSLHSIIRSAISLIMPNAQAIEISGQPIELDRNYQSALVLLMQDMARNAIKNGVAPEKIHISWKRNGQNKLNIAWQEKAIETDKCQLSSLDSSVVNRLMTLNQKNKIKSLRRSQNIEYVLDLCLEDA